MNIKATFATTFWAIFVSMVFVSPNCAVVAGFLSFCVLIGILVARTDVEPTEEDKSILSWIGTAASLVILLGVVYWGLIQ